MKFWSLFLSVGTAVMYHESSSTMASPPAPARHLREGTTAANTTTTRSNFFPVPEVNGYRLDTCAVFITTGRPNDTTCGQTSADMFCASQGFAHASSFKKDEGYGHTTWIIGNSTTNEVQTQGCMLNVTCV